MYFTHQQNNWLTSCLAHVWSARHAIYQTFRIFAVSRSTIKKCVLCVVGENVRTNTAAH